MGHARPVATDLVQPLPSPGEEPARPVPALPQSALAASLQLVSKPWSDEYIQFDR